MKALGLKRWGVGGAVSQKFASKGFFTVLTTRKEANAAPLAAAIREQGGDCMIVELDLVSEDSIATAFATIRREAVDPDVLIYNAGYLEGRDLPPDRELLEYVPVEILDTGLHIAARGPFLVAKEDTTPSARSEQIGFSQGAAASIVGVYQVTGCNLVRLTGPGSQALSQFPIGGTVTSLGGLRCDGTAGGQRLVVMSADSNDGETYQTTEQRLQVANGAFVASDPPVTGTANGRIRLSQNSRMLPSHASKRAAILRRSTLRACSWDAITFKRAVRCAGTGNLAMARRPERNSRVDSR